MNTEKEHTEEEILRKHQQPDTLEEEHEGHEQEMEAEVEESVDYSHLSKEELMHTAEGLLKEQDYKKVDAILRQIKPVFDEIKDKERGEALEKFIAEGGEQDDFDYKADEVTHRFEQAYRQLKEKKAKQLQDSEREKEKNLQAKNALLDKLRQLTDAEETTASIAALKQIQDEWKTIGPVPAAQAKNLWANYNALIELFYSNRSIYFELKELDRKKNLTLKQEICEKAEKLAEQAPSSQVIKELNDLHEEYKHVGPVPKEEQEALWQRFKAASDVIYNKRREQLEVSKKEMQNHLQVKTTLSEKAEQFTSFNSSKISDWNDKTKEILELQKQWESVGPVPKEKAKDVNKRFWAAFKTFFHNKNEFFKNLEAYREENLQKKTELCERVEALNSNEEVDLEQAAEQVKHLQQEWKDIGPVPEKQRNHIFDRFKSACDAFFDKRRGQRNQVERQYEVNYEKKVQICEAIEKMAASGEADVKSLEQLRSEWQNTGFVPRKHMHSIQKRYSDAIQQFLQQSKQLSDRDKDKIQLSVEMNASRTNPKAMKQLHKKEASMRKRLSQIENDIALWKNNMEFFANSKTATKLKEEFNQKIEAAQQEYNTLKRQIQLIHENE
ncbi:DUF349 domain-containing protein [Rhodocytophaga aerolata]|uniref:DUF349 domain-containing protein n=1 Tax=Rhodocytophaga aerolata TaxID=455078 RepID=A0ABT8R0A4_9BACT|nr:DUF349 domain-containing protein [Rhodocytophaga aerolata]MDO1444688.1 DUF349 domain-containing protein [Rhodocytophaga aerolata]